MTTQLNFSDSEHIDAETDKPIQYGTFSRDWAEEELDELIDGLEGSCISQKQHLLRAQKLLIKFPRQLEIQNFIANRLWSLEMRDESTDVREKAHRKATALIPPARLQRPDFVGGCGQPLLLAHCPRLSAGADAPG